MLLPFLSPLWLYLPRCLTLQLRYLFRWVWGRLSQAPHRQQTLQLILMTQLHEPMIFEEWLGEWTYIVFVFLSLYLCRSCSAVIFVVYLFHFVCILYPLNKCTYNIDYKIIHFSYMYLSALDPFVLVVVDMIIQLTCIFELYISMTRWYLLSLNSSIEGNIKFSWG